MRVVVLVSALSVTCIMHKLFFEIKNISSRKKKLAGTGYKVDDLFRNCVH